MVSLGHTYVLFLKIRFRGNIIRSRENGIIIRANGIRSRENGLIIRANGIRSRENGLIIRENGIRSRENGTIIHNELLTLTLLKNRCIQMHFLAFNTSFKVLKDLLMWIKYTKNYR